MVHILQQWTASIVMFTVQRIQYRSPVSRHVTSDFTLEISIQLDCVVHILRQWTASIVMFTVQRIEYQSPVSSHVISDLTLEIRIQLDC